MTRTEMIQKVKSLNVETERPPHMLPTARLQEILKKREKKEELTMKTRILELHKEGKDKKQIKAILESEGWEGKVKCGKVRPMYIHIVLKNNK